MPEVFLKKVYWTGAAREWVPRDSGVAAATPALVETASGRLRAISRSKTSGNCQKPRSLRVAPDNMASTGLGRRITSQNMKSTPGLCGHRGTLRISHCPGFSCPRMSSAPPAQGFPGLCGFTLEILHHVWYPLRVVATLVTIKRICTYVCGSGKPQ